MTGLLVARDRTSAAWVVGASAAIALVVAASSLHGEPLLGVVGAALFGAALFFPEVTFPLFLNAGAFKASPRLASVGFDLTLFLEAACAAGILLGIARGRIRLRRPPPAMLLAHLALLAVAVPSVLYTPSPVYGHEKLLRLLVTTSFSLWAPWFLFQEWSRIHRFLFTWLALSTAMSLDIVTSGLDPGDAAFQQAFGSSGYQGLGTVCSQAVVILLFAGWLRAGQRWWLGAIVGLTVLNLFGALVSGARTSVAVLFTIVVAALLYWTVRAAASFVAAGRLLPKYRRFLTLMVGFVLAAGALVAWGRPYFRQLEFRTALLVLAPGEFETDRIQLAPAAARVIRRTPLGLGIGGFSMYYFGYDARRGGFPHNIFLEAGAELGVIGLAALLVLCGAGLAAGLQGLARAHGPEYTTRLTFVVLFCFMLLYYQFHGDLTDARVLFTWIGTLFAVRRLVAGQGSAHA